MAWRFEQTKTGTDIVIDGWDKGIGASPTSGIQDLRSVNLVSMPGVVSVGYGITTNTISGATLGKPVSRAVAFSGGSATTYYVLDAGGQVFSASGVTGTWTFLSSNNSTSGSSDKDTIAYWKGYLFKFRNSSIDYWNGTTWATAWKSIIGGVTHYAITPINDKLYFCNGTTVGSITEIGTFDPTSAGTYNFNTATFTLPSIDSAVSLAQLGTGTADSTITILVGGAQNVIYPFLSTATSFQTPIYIADYYIRRMVSVNQSVFIFPGNVQGRGRIYITNSTQAQEFFKIPDGLTGYNDVYYEWGDAIFHRGSLLFGFFANKNDGTGVVGGMADVWALDLNTKAYRSISTINTSSNYSNATVLISDQSNAAVSGMAYAVGWTDNASANFLGNSSTTVGIGGATVKTDQIPLGTFFQRFNPRQIEVRLQAPLLSGESVQVIPIIDGASTGATFTINTVGAISGQAPANFQNAQWVQFQLTLTGNGQTSGCRVQEIRIHGVPNQ